MRSQINVEMGPIQRNWKDLMITDGSLIKWALQPTQAEMDTIFNTRMTQALEPVPISQLTAGIASATLFT